MSHGALESILIVYQNPRPGTSSAYDDWYTNIHIRDALRLEGALATQRFVEHVLQPVEDGAPVRPQHWAHTLYEWESAAASVRGHHERMGTPDMEILTAGDFAGLRDYFYRPEYLSHGWTLESGFRRGSDVLTALILPRPGEQAKLIEWFREHHAPATLGLPGFSSAALFSYHEQQSLPIPCRYPLAAVYGLADVPTALEAWSARQGARDGASLADQAAEVEAGCWRMRIERLLARDVLNPSPLAAAEEERARNEAAGNYYTRDQLFSGLEAT